MRDLDETEVRERLSQLAGGIDLRPSLERPTIRRARRRRATTAAASTLVVVALVAGSYAGVRAFLGGTGARIGNDPSPAPTPAFEGLWPETDADGLAEIQRAVDEGHHPLRLDPAGTATEFATNLMNWPPAQVVSKEIELEPDGTVVVELRNEAFSDTVPSVVVRLRQLGVTGPDGVWSVVDVSSALLEEVMVFEISPGRLGVSGRLTDLFEGSSLAVHVLDGATFETAVAQARVQLVDERFDVELEVPATPDGRGTVLVWVPDAVGMSLGTIARPVETPIATTPPTSPPPGAADVTGVPPVVAATAERIHDAALARDYEALAGLMDPNNFSYNFDDGSDPIPAWREDPSVLDVMASVLELPPVPIDVEGMGRFYVWPYLMHADLTDPTPGQLRDLERLGIGPDELQGMLDAFGGYVGPRLSIDETGLWRNFVIGGD